MSRKFNIFAWISIFALIIAISVSQANWTGDGIPVCTASRDQLEPKITSDGQNGAIIVWTDDRASNYDIYAQRVDADGNIQWALDGVAICDELNDQDEMQIAAVGDSHVVATWVSEYWPYGMTVFAQKINIEGVVSWGSLVMVNTNSDEHSQPRIIADGAGGTIICWRNQPGLYGDILAQKIDSGGNLDWDAAGVDVCTEGADQLYPRMVTDGSGGAIITWHDYRNSNSDIYAQRVDNAGNTMWTADGIEICTRTGYQGAPLIASDGSGGAFITWSDEEVYVQRVNANGDTILAAGGISISSGASGSIVGDIAPDGSGGAFLVWEDYRDSDYHIYIQRIDSDGNRLWGPDDVPVCTAAGPQYSPRLALDQSGCLIVTWWDMRVGTDFNVYAQKIDSEGNILWIEDGVEICTASNHQKYVEITTGAYGGAVITWQDERGGVDIYSQYVGPNGKTGIYPSPCITSVTDVQNDQGGKLHIQWDGSYLDYYPRTYITHYSIWRRLPVFSSSITPVPERSPSMPAIPLDFDSQAIRTMENGHSWEWIGNMTARHFENYTYTAESLYDSTGSSTGWQYFMVSAHTETSYVYYDSEVDSGYSVDNLAPCIPESLSAEQLYSPAGLDLSWEQNEEEDLSQYRIYRGADGEFVPGPGNLLATAVESWYFDETWHWSEGYYYKVSAEDVHGNESGYALIGPDGITGDEPSTPPLQSYLEQNCPNPFNPQTTISFGLGKAGPVSLKIFDCMGREVATLIDKRLPPGHYSKKWNGTLGDGRRVTSGVYLYQLRTNSFTKTRKMILIQ